MIPPIEHYQPVLLDGDLYSSLRFRHRLSIKIYLLLRANRFDFGIAQVGSVG